jgi:hypothetical protein
MQVDVAEAQRRQEQQFEDAGGDSDIDFMTEDEEEYGGQEGEGEGIVGAGIAALRGTARGAATWQEVCAG